MYLKFGGSVEFTNGEVVYYYVKEILAGHISRRGCGDCKLLKISKHV